MTTRIRHTLIALVLTLAAACNRSVPTGPMPVDEEPRPDLVAPVSE